MDDVTPIRKPEIIGEAGGPVDESRVTLALYGDDLEPDAVSQRLGCRATQAHKRGDRPRPKSLPAKCGAWFLSVEGFAPVGPDQLVRLLLERFPQQASFWAELRRDYDVRVLVAIHTDGWNRGFELGAEATRLLALTGAATGFDLYLYGEGDDRS
jgi:hypothetical protein